MLFEAVVWVMLKVLFGVVCVWVEGGGPISVCGG